MRHLPIQTLKKGEIEEGILILLTLLIIIFLFIIPSQGPVTTSHPSLLGSQGGQFVPKNTTNDYANLNIGTGNASYEYQSYAEYITLANRGRTGIDITGFKLKNSKGDKVFQVGSNLQTFNSDAVEIPQGSLYISPTGQSPHTDIILKGGETAILTTGSIGVTSPYTITSFKENMCSGYLQTQGDYTFTPGLSLNCPRASEEPGFSNLDENCQNFISNFSYCHIPEFNGLDRDRNICNGCVDGKAGLSNACIAFVQNHFNYKSCLANHVNDPNFNGNTWRVFLGYGWELWAKDNETISLFDRLGKLIDTRSY